MERELDDELDDEMDDEPVDSLSELSEPSAEGRSLWKKRRPLGEPICGRASGRVRRCNHNG